MANWEEGKYTTHYLKLAGGVLTVTASYDAVRRGDEFKNGFKVRVFGAQLAQLFPDLDTAKRKAESVARKYLERALSELPPDAP